MIIESGDLRIRLGGGARWTITLPNLKPGTPSTTRPDTVVQVFRRDVDSPPVASFTIDANETDGTVTVTDTSTDAVGLDVVDIDWGDGTVDEDLAPGGTYQRQYATTDTYTIELTATDTSGQTDRASQSVSVTVLWTPAELDADLTAWYDALDASTLTLRDDGGTDKVEQWDDKSGNTHDVAQGTATLRPVYDGQAVSGDGADDYLQNNTVNQPQPNWIFSVADTSVAGVNDGLYDGVTTRQHLFDFAETGLFAGTVVRLSLDSRANNLIGVHFDSPNSIVRRNGIQDATGLDVGTEALGGLIMFNNTGLSQPIEASMQMLVVTADIDTADVERMEGYAAHRYGLEAKLPSGHPYKSSPPTV